MTHDNVTDIVERCPHGVRWPHPCDDCHEEDMKPHNLIARIEAQDDTIATLRKQLENAREALRDIARPRHGHQALAEDGKEQPKHLYPYYAGVVSQLQNKAREALKGHP